MRKIAIALDLIVMSAAPSFALQQLDSSTKAEEAQAQAQAQAAARAGATTNAMGHATEHASGQVSRF